MQSYDGDEDEPMESMKPLDANPSPSLLQPPSGRKGSKKVRSGCITCKIRKVKCDEAKPYCTRCTKTGRKCDGYLDASALAIRRRRRRRSTNPDTSLDEGSPSAPSSKSKLQLDTDQQYIASLSASAKHRGIKGTISSSAKTSLPQSVGILSWATSAQEKRAFDFFQTITAPCLAGDLDAIFWRVLVLQVCHTEPAVRHAVLAISSLHELFLRPAKSSSSKAESSSDTSSIQEFALLQYNKAIAHMLDDMKGDKTSSDDEQEDDDESDTNDYQSYYQDGDRDATGPVLQRPVAPLITCILFLCIEVMQGKDKEALIHLEQGRHILSQLDDSRQQSANQKEKAGKDQKKKKPTRGTSTGGHPAEMAVVRQHLVPLYTRLSMTSFLFGGSPLPIPPSLKSASSPTTSAVSNSSSVIHTIPGTFDSIHGLRASVHDFLDAVLRFTRKARPSKYPRRAASPPPTPSATPASTSTSASAHCPSVSPSSASAPVSGTSICISTLESEKKTLLAQLRRLRIALSLFRVNKSPTPTVPLDTKSAPANTFNANFNSNAATLALLQIHLSIAEIWLETALTQAEAAFDAHVETFSSVIPLAATVLDIERQHQQHQQQKSQYQSQNQNCSVFTLETHIIPALYFVATKCRHGPVRHTALAMLLENSGRRENLWRADVLGSIAARIIEIEEGWVRVKKEEVERDSNDDTKSIMSHESTPTPTPTDSLHAISGPWFATSLNMDDDLPGLYSPHVQDWQSAVPAQTGSTESSMGVFSANTTGAGGSDTGMESGHRPSWHNSGGSIDGSFVDNDIYYFGEEGTAGNMPNVPNLLAAVNQEPSSDAAAAALPALFLSPPTPTASGLGSAPAVSAATRIWPRPSSVPLESDVQSPSSIAVSSPAVSSFDTESLSLSPSPASPGSSRREQLDNSDGFCRPSTDAPFDVPENARVYVAVIGAEEPTGRWVTLFCKPNGLDGAWDVRSEFVGITV